MVKENQVSNTWFSNTFTNTFGTQLKGLQDIGYEYDWLMS